MEKLDTSIVETLHSMARDGQPPSQMFRTLEQHLGQTHILTILHYFQHAFCLTLSEAKPFAALSRNETREVKDEAFLDGFVWSCHCQTSTGVGYPLCIGRGGHVRQRAARSMIRVRPANKGGEAAFLAPLRRKFFNRPGTLYVTPEALIVYLDPFKEQDALTGVIDAFNAQEHRLPWLDSRRVVVSLAPRTRTRLPGCACSLTSRHAESTARRAK